MRKRWEVHSIEIHLADTPPERDQRLLAQTGEILYLFSCQLARQSTPAETTWAASEIRRTGANG